MLPFILDALSPLRVFLFKNVVILGILKTTTSEKQKHKERNINDHRPNPQCRNNCT